MNLFILSWLLLGLLAHIIARAVVKWTYDNDLYEEKLQKYAELMLSSPFLISSMIVFVILGYISFIYVMIIMIRSIIVTINKK